MYCLKFTLKQHTPLIHFQHDQDGATLRASEVKPRLDRFLISKLQMLTPDGKIKNEFKAWFNSTDHKSLNYKLKIVDNDPRSINEREGEVTLIPPNKENTILSNSVYLRFLILKEKLRTEIENNIEEFFILNSFGKRNNKGFGSYYVFKEKDFITWDKLKAKLPAGSFIKERFIQRKISKVDFRDEYKKITEFQRVLKSGINYNDYIKSKLFVYSIKKNIRWEKRWIKKELKKLIDDKVLPSKLKSRKAPNDWCKTLDINSKNGSCSNNDWVDHKGFDNNYYFIRILLGLTEHWEFLTVDYNLKYKVIPENGDVERFKSPLTFKVFEDNIYLILDGEPSNLSRYPFKFKVQQKVKDINGKWTDSGYPIYLKDENDQELTLFPPVINHDYNLTDFISICIEESLGFTKI